MKSARAFHLGSTLRRLFGAEERAAEVSKNKSGDRASRLDRPTVPVGRFSMVGLAELKSHLGERWPGLSERVHAIAAGVIERHLLPGDVFEATGEEGYVVLFAQLGQREADFKCRLIGKEIAQRLLGSEWKGLERVDSACAEVPVAALKDGGLDAVIEDAFAKVEGAAHPPTAEPAPPTPGRGPPPAPARARPASGPLIAPIVKPAAEWCYQPIWDFAQSAMIFFRLVHAEEAEGAGQGPATADARFAQDCWALKKAIADIITLSGHDRRLPIVCPIHAAGLDSGGRGRAVAKLIGVLPPHLRRVLILELTTPPAWPGITPLHATISALKALKVGVWARLPIDTRPVDMMNPEFGAVTAQLPRTNPPERECMIALDAFAARAKSSGLSCGVAGVNTRSLALAASAAGFRYLSGRAIRSEVHSLEQATRYDLARLYRGVASEAVL